MGHSLVTLLHIAVACQFDVCSLVIYFQYLLGRFKITNDLTVEVEQRNGEIKTQLINIIGVKFDFLKCYLILHPWSDLLPVAVMVLTKNFILLKFNLTFGINYEFEIVL